MKVRTTILMFAMAVAVSATAAVTTPPVPAAPVEPAQQQPVQPEAETKQQPGETEKKDSATSDDKQKNAKNSPAKVTSKKQEPPVETHEKTADTASSDTATTNTTATTATANVDTSHTDTVNTGTSATTDTTQTVDGDAPRPAAPWLLYAVLAAIAVALGAITWVAARLFRRMSAPDPKLDDTELGRRLNKLATNVDASFGLVVDKLQRRTQELSAALIALPTADQLEARIATLRQDIAKLTEIVETIATAPEAPQRVAPPPDPISLEHQVLGETWKQFRANKELSTVFENALQESACEPLINDLTKVVPDDLKPTFEAVVAPWREHRTLVQKISLVPRIVNGEIKRLDNDAEELRRTREYASLLTNAGSSTDGAARLNFRFKSWVTDTFLPFADLYLQRYQQAQLEKPSTDLNSGASLVRQVLRIAAVEPIDVTLGETPFDSSRHVGRSTTNDPRFLDGVITGVVRNGFIERGQQVIRQPEVIVNRMR